MMASRLPGSTGSTSRPSSEQTAPSSSQHAPQQAAAAVGRVRPAAARQLQQQPSQQAWAGSGVTSLTSPRLWQQTRCARPSCSCPAVVRRSSRAPVQCRQRLLLPQGSCQPSSPRGPCLVSCPGSGHCVSSCDAPVRPSWVPSECRRSSTTPPVWHKHLLITVALPYCAVLLACLHAVPSRDPASTGRLVLQSLGSPDWWPQGSSSSGSWEDLEGAMLAAVAGLRLAVQDATCAAVVTCPAGESDPAPLCLFAASQLLADRWVAVTANSLVGVGWAAAGMLGEVVLGPRESCFPAR